MRQQEARKYLRTHDVKKESPPSTPQPKDKKGRIKPLEAVGGTKKGTSTDLTTPDTEELSLTEAIAELKENQLEDEAISLKKPAETDSE